MEAKKVKEIHLREIAKKINQQKKWYDRLPISLTRIRIAIRQFRRRFLNFFKNAWYYRSFLIEDEPYDFEFLYYAMGKKFELMEDFFNSDSAIAQGSEKVAKDMKLVKNLTKRLKDDVYWDKVFENKVFDVDEGLKFERVRESEQQDINLLFSTIQKKYRNWWD